ncbi:hypothetical protein K0M31_009836 [Melipona bicolor]|uniref:Uncharacterized protein n=1 Tax=Melipona bicolor TaxID=60889 RepID=A0AA40FN49_9HYME|nr:hypothetical protein K0M31_009836 [Melipona bicolor]
MPTLPPSPTLSSVLPSPPSTPPHPTSTAAAAAAAAAPHPIYPLRDTVSRSSLFASILSHRTN